MIDAILNILGIAFGLFGFFAIVVFSVVFALWYMENKK